MTSAYPHTLMEAGFKIIPGKEAEFFAVQSKMVATGMAQPGFAAVYGGPIADSSWLYFSVRFESPAQMDAWHRQPVHQQVQRMAYRKWWTNMYIRKWQRPQSGVREGDRFLCETFIERQEAMLPQELRAARSEFGRLGEFGVNRFETHTGEYEPQPYQFVGPLEIAPTPAPVVYALITHWSDHADAVRWQESPSYGALRALGTLSTETFVPYAEESPRDFLRGDRLQRDWRVAEPSA